MIEVPQNSGASLYFSVLYCILGLSQFDDPIRCPASVLVHKIDINQRSKLLDRPVVFSKLKSVCVSGYFS